MSQVHDKLIGPVPARIVDAARATLIPGEGKVMEYNVAAWIQLPGMAELPVSLIVRFVDGNTPREVTVDHGKVNPLNKIMLSGVARLPVKQKIEDMQVHLRSAVPVNILMVEELFVQAVEQRSADDRQVQA
jgi:hypothetical protein